MIIILRKFKCLNCCHRNVHAIDKVYKNPKREILPHDSSSIAQIIKNPKGREYIHN